MPLRLSATEMTTAATIGKIGTVQRHNATGVDKRVTSSQLAAMCMDCHKRKCPYRGV